VFLKCSEIEALLIEAAAGGAALCCLPHSERERETRSLCLGGAQTFLMNGISSRAGRT